MVNRLSPDYLTAGVIDDHARHTFKYGACGALAIALHDATAWPVFAITDASDVKEGVACCSPALHWVVKRPDGCLIDIDGAHDADDLIAQYAYLAQDGIAVAVASTRENVHEWYVEVQGEPIPLQLAISFVDSVLTAPDHFPQASHPERERSQC